MPLYVPFEARSVNPDLDKQYHNVIIIKYPSVLSCYTRSIITSTGPSSNSSFLPSKTI